LDEEELEFELAKKSMRSEKEQRARGKKTDETLADKLFGEYQHHDSRTLKSAEGKTRSRAHKKQAPPSAVGKTRKVIEHGTKVAHFTRTSQWKPSVSATTSPIRSVKSVTDAKTHSHSQFPNESSGKSREQTSTVNVKNHMIRAQMKKLQPGHKQQAKVVKNSSESLTEGVKSSSAATKTQDGITKVRRHPGNMSIPAVIMEEENKASDIPEPLTIDGDGAAKVVVERSSKVVQPPLPEEPPVSDEPRVSAKKKVALSPHPEIEESADTEITSYIIWSALGLLVVGMLTTVMCLACQPDRARPWGMPPKRNY